MFGLGVGELSIVALVLIVVVGPKHLPKLMANVGKVLKQVRRATEDLKSSIGYDDVMRSVDVRKEIYRKPVPKKPKAAQHGAANYRMTAADRENEYPTEGVDQAYQKRLEREAEENVELHPHDESVSEESTTKIATDEVDDAEAEISAAPATPEDGAS